MVETSEVQNIFTKALALHQAGELVLAEKLYQSILAINPQHDETLHLLGLIRYVDKKFEESAMLISAALAIDPNFKVAQFNLARCYEEMNELESARKAYERAIVLDPNSSEGYLGLSNIQARLLMRESALLNINRAIERKPNFAPAYLNKGVLLARMSRHHEAIHFYNTAKRLDPTNSEIAFGLAKSLAAIKLYDEAIQNYNRAISKKPEYAEAYAGRANALKELKRYNESIGDYNKALELNPELDGANFERLYTCANICDWSRFETDVSQFLLRASAEKITVEPFGLLTFCNSRKLQFEATKKYATKFGGQTYNRSSMSSHSKRKIRIGYFSGDFRSHPVTQLVAGVFENHDRNKYDVELFSFGPNTGDNSQKRVMNACDSYFHLGSLDLPNAVKFVRERNVDIAIDLSGYTDLNRAGLFAFRVAPIQVNYLGYSGTMGAGFMDYIISDANVIPTDHQPHYSEQVVHLPDCFLPNDRSRALVEDKISRKAMGLPENATVFCCFNTANKLNPHLFALWMNILKRLPNSVLWLVADNEWIVSNLHKEAQAHGVDPQRLIFAARVPASDYFSRYRCADVFLDTLPYNAHTTACDALWAGLPVLTQTGETFASRVAASALSTIGIPEMITTSDKEYEDKAVWLANNLEELGMITKRLRANVGTSPLFDIERYTKHLEGAFETMVARAKDGLPPRHITVDRI